MRNEPALPARPARPFADGPLRGLVQLGLVIAGYLLGAGTIVLAERSFGHGAGIWALALDIGLLSWLVVVVGRRGSPQATQLGPLLALLVVILFFAVCDWWWNDLAGGFWSLRNLRTVAVQTSTIAVAALGMTVIIIAGGIDLSAGTALALSATVLASFLDQGWSISVAVVACLLTGFLSGVVNGGLISALRVVPFIITLGTMTAYLGLAKIVAKETTVRPPLDSIPDWLPALVTPVPQLEWLAYPLLPNFGWGVWLALVLALLLAAVLHFSVFGRYVFAIGSNEATARLCGIPVWAVKTAVYALGGLFVGIAGMYQFARLSSGTPTSGVGLELKVIAAVVIGGGSLRGGRGSVVGSLTGAAIMLVIASGCTALGLRNPIQDIIIGAIIVAAVTLDQFRQGRLTSERS